MVIPVGWGPSSFPFLPEGPFFPEQRSNRERCCYEEVSDQDAKAKRIFLAQLDFRKAFEQFGKNIERQFTPPVSRPSGTEDFGYPP